MSGTKDTKLSPAFVPGGAQESAEYCEETEGHGESPGGGHVLQAHLAHNKVPT